MTPFVYIRARFVGNTPELLDIKQQKVNSWTLNNTSKLDIQKLSAEALPNLPGCGLFALHADVEKLFQEMHLSFIASFEIR